jgi:ABC-2 type transport system permease protein
MNSPTLDRTTLDRTTLDRTTLDPATRSVPPFGGFNTTLLGIELKRMLRNRRTVIFTLVFPAALFFAFGGQSDWNDKVGLGNVAAYVMVSMALYGAALTAASGGAMVALERSLGWSRQLRLTPLHPVAYILTKALIALLMGAIAVTVVNVAGKLQGKPSMPADTWLQCAGLGVLCTLVFAALGVFVGYLVPGENAMQVLGPGLALFSFLGDVFIPIAHGSTMWHLAAFTPMFGVAEITRAPMTHYLPWYAVLNAIVWFGIFVTGAAWRMSKDTARV